MVVFKFNPARAIEDMARNKRKRRREDEVLWSPCWRCGHQFDVGVKVCPQCGAKRKK